MKCATCPAVSLPGDCPGEYAPRVCDLARTREDYRRAVSRAAGGAVPEEAPAAAPTPEQLAAVRACPHRGSVLPVSLQPECGCAELTECRAGQGKVAGRVTLRDCLDCGGRG